MRIKTSYIIIIIFLFALNSYSQCLCGNLQIQIPINDLNLKGYNSNYELIVNEKTEKYQYNSRSLKKNDFTNDTLNLNFRTGAGIRKLKIELKNKHKSSSMQLSILNMTYDNDYLIEISKFISGSYLFDWKKIDDCQSQNRTSQKVKCDGMEFVQLNLQAKSSNFNVNRIRILELEHFVSKKDDFKQKKQEEVKTEIKARIESLFLSEVNSIYHLEKNKYLFTQRKVSGNGNHYYDEIILRIISFSKNKITLYPIDIEIKNNNGYLDENGCLTISQNQLYDFNDNMFIKYDDASRILEYQFNDIDIQSNNNLSELKNIQYQYVDGTFKLISEKSKKIQLD